MRYTIAIVVLIAVWLLFHKPSPDKPLVGLPSQEQNYYEEVFNYTMDNIQPDSHFDWKTYDAEGSIGVAKPFISKSGYTCRNFTENYTVTSTNQTGNDTGIACKRAEREGWCKLKISDALTCAMENPSYHIGMPGVGSVPDAPNVNIDSPNYSGNANSGYNTNVSPRNNGNKPTATDAANTVTGTAGSAAGYVAKNAGGWFGSLFR